MGIGDWKVDKVEFMSQLITHYPALSTHHSALITHYSALHHSQGLRMKICVM
ncbi:hypothetical protein [Nostoc sp. CMAA1605]|uniref:hypothetical protein n=1 Tax=Nostoc sp. CMAA1605 TaxID=2055159 RepID=UPI001F356B40|nr:hypothetical protein [Nostoc sp. CMAA1605]